MKCINVADVCLDANECNASSPVCDKNAACQNTHGSYRCTCNAGFAGDGKTCQGKKKVKNNGLMTLYDSEDKLTFL